MNVRTELDFFFSAALRLPNDAGQKKRIFAELQPKVPGLVEVALWTTPERCVRVN